MDGRTVWEGRFFIRFEVSPDLVDPAAHLLHLADIFDACESFHVGGFEGYHHSGVHFQYGFHDGFEVGKVGSVEELRGG